MDEPVGRAKGGVARAESLSPKERKAQARRAANARWEPMPFAEYGSVDRPLRIGPIEIPCYVLSDKRRVVTFNGVVTGLDMSKGGRGYAKGRGDRITRFLTGKTMTPFVPNDLLAVIERPIKFRIQLGPPLGSITAHGYEATVLADLCEAVLEARRVGALYPQQAHIADRCEILVRGFARVGIIALVDEATGFQKDRERDALAEILEEFIAKELQPYIRLFPSAFYENLYRLRGLELPKDSRKKPQYFGHLTNDVIYARLAPGVLEELRKIVPRRDTGHGRKYPFTRRLTEDFGHPKLREHLASVTTIMKLSDKYEDFESKLDRIHPRYDTTLPLPFYDEAAN